MDLPPDFRRKSWPHRVCHVGMHLYLRRESAPAVQVETQILDAERRIDRVRGDRLLLISSVKEQEAVQWFTAILGELQQPFRCLQRKEIACRSQLAGFYTPETMAKHRPVEERELSRQAVRFSSYEGCFMGTPGPSFDEVGKVVCQMDVVLADKCPRLCGLDNQLPHLPVAEKAGNLTWRQRLPYLASRLPMRRFRRRQFRCVDCGDADRLHAEAMELRVHMHASFRRPVQIDQVAIHMRRWARRLHFRRLNSRSRMKAGITIAAPSRK